MQDEENEPYDTLGDSEWEELGRIWDLLEEGEKQSAHHALHALLSARPNHPDLLVAKAALHLSAGEARQALAILRGAERSADPALFFHLRATAHYDRAEFEAARDDSDRALTVHPDFAESHELLSRIWDHLGDAAKASGHSHYATSLDPERFPALLEFEDADFDALVEASLGELPAAVRKHLEELPVLVESLPARDVLTAEEPPLSPDLLGLFVGSSLLEQDSTTVSPGPGAIYLFRRNLLRACEDRDTLAKEVRTTVLHEVGHLLGLDEDDLDAWGLA